MSGSTSESLEGQSTSRASLRKHACAHFLAGDTPLKIIPSFNYEQLGLISRPVGPFMAGMDVVVPLWLGVMLRRKGLCRILAPDWMEVGFLENVLQFERDPSEASFSPDLPHAHAEMARAILAACATGSSGGNVSGTTSRLDNENSGGGGDEIPNADQIKLLLEDIATVRMDKIRRNVHTLSHQTLSKESSVPIIDVSGIGSLEILTVRPFLQTAFKYQGMLAKPPSSSNNSNNNNGNTISSNSNAQNRQEQETSNDLSQTQLPSRIRRFR